MTNIDVFSFSDGAFDDIKHHHYGMDRPIVYLIQGKRELYVGETISAYKRTKQHFTNAERRRLNTIYILSDETFNKSAVLDIESSLIQYMVADQQFVLQNKNSGLENHNYYNRELYQSKFEALRQKLQDIGLAKHNLTHLRNSDLFKYSPYKSLSSDQLDVANEILEKVSSSQEHTFLVNGKPGTGKTILAIYLLKLLRESEDTKHMSVGLVVPMTSLRDTLKKVFRSIKGLKSSMVLGPNDVVKKHYDILLVDESHRLQRRKGITNYGSFDTTNRKLGLGSEGTQVDWIMKSSSYQIFFYDSNQSVRPADLPTDYWSNIDATSLTLSSQMRVQGGDEYIGLIGDLFDGELKNIYKINDYDLQLFHNIEAFYNAIQHKNNEHGLCRMVAGFAWERVSNKPETGKDYDIVIDGLKLKWNNTTKNRVNSYGAEKEVGCIHTIQGYDLNYVGVIIGNEIAFDPDTGSFIIHKEHYKDVKGKAGIDDYELTRYIINIYKTLLTRGIIGTYIYVVDPHLRKYINEILQHKINLTNK